MSTGSAASPRLFENDLLDKLSRVHWSTPLFVYLPVVALLAVLSLQSFSLPVVLALRGARLFHVDLTEYLGHRYLFHYKFPGEFGARIHFLIHGVHHDASERSAAPRHAGAAQRADHADRLCGRARASCSACLMGYPVLMGFIIGYLGYDMVHYYVHHAEPTTRLGRRLRRLHMLHHFRDPDARLRRQRALVGLCVRHAARSRTRGSPPTPQAPPDPPGR